MSLLVQKFGGTSVADLDKISFVAEQIAAAKRQGHSIVVVVSAMAKETDRLEAMANCLSSQPKPRELDILLATGEQVSMSLLCIALQNMGINAKSYTGLQLGIKTDDIHCRARILEVATKKLQQELDQDCVVVVAGFQGVNAKGDFTTLGRGGSDTTAVAIAAALNADECHIYTDVEGVYTTDPRIVPDARKIDKITFEEMLELASLGAKVLQMQAVEYAGKYKIPLRVLSTFSPGSGTLISYEVNNMHTNVVTGVTFSAEEAQIQILGLPNSPGVAAQILRPLSQVNIEIDMLLQSKAANNKADFTFTVPRKHLKLAISLVKDCANELGAKDVTVDDKVAKLSLVGAGMRSHFGVASKMFAVLGKEGVNIQLIVICEIKVSVLINEKYLELGVRSLHEAFALAQKNNKVLSLELT